MKCKWRFWRRKKGHSQEFRRIYRGDVPIITDKDIDNQLGGKSDSTMPSLNSDTVETNSDTKSKLVQRNSFVGDRAHRKKSRRPEKFPSNYILTSRYNAWNFLPKCLFEQFRRVVNFYFLFIALIQVNVDSPVHPAAAVLPLAFVIMASTVKQGYEDWLRHRNDDIVNNRILKIVKNGVVEETKSKDVVVGDIIRLEENDQVPVDVLLLASSDEYLRCQINTANLDGETNLKLRYCPSGIPNFKTPMDFEKLHAILECEHPNENLYAFTGSLLFPAEKLADMHWTPSETTTSMDTSEGCCDKSACKMEHIQDLKNTALIHQGVTDFVSIPVSMDNMTLRGTRLKNTEYIYGMVVYTGTDTRLARNTEKTQAKFSTVEVRVNIYLTIFIVFLIFLVIFCTVMHFHWGSKSINGQIPWYIGEPPPKTPYHIWNTFGGFVVLFNYIIPISLYVTVEMQKFMGSKFFVWDEEMVDEEGREPLCNTSDLNEELGQIEYLFSDKTGTLTQNIMEFRHCTINAVRYEYNKGKLYVFKSPTVESKESVSPADIQKLQNVLHFFRVLALCHSVQVVAKRKNRADMEELSISTVNSKAEKKDDRALNSRRLCVTPEASKNETAFLEMEKEFQASSPDEKALVESCAALGVTYIGEKEDVLTLNILGSTEQYRRLMHLEFDPDRKRMSVIVENENGEIWLYTKGAESSIIPNCDSGPGPQTYQHVMNFAMSGLRTLAVAEKQLTEDEFEAFNAELRHARRLIKCRQEKIHELYGAIESRMTLLGATGVEDQLQDNVPETLESFAAAGIRVWMLTGDQLETGINVAISCNLIVASTKKYIISKTTDPETIKQLLEQYKAEMNPDGNTCFVIDGESLAVAMKECFSLLRDVSMSAQRVICCRMAPLQKAQVVQMVKSSPRKPTCCAVGDGANDCAMILAAHIGIGILGKEGRQAARCADFALAKFGFLKKAVLVHGHWYYVRLANLANYFFYKNVVFCIPQLFYSIHSNFSSQAIFESIFMMCFNIFFASAPIFFYGLTEQPFPAEVLLNNPQLYKRNSRNALLAVNNFVRWILSGIWHPAVCFYVTYYAWQNFQHVNFVESFGTCVFTGVVLVANAKLAVEAKSVSILNVAALLFSLITFVAITLIYSEIDLSPILVSPSYQSIFARLLRSCNFWLLEVLVACISMLPDVTMVLLRQPQIPLNRKTIKTAKKNLKRTHEEYDFLRHAE